MMFLIGRTSLICNRFLMILNSVNAIMLPDVILMETPFLEYITYCWQLLQLE